MTGIERDKCRKIDEKSHKKKPKTLGGYEVQLLQDSQQIRSYSSRDYAQTTWLKGHLGVLFLDGAGEWAGVICKDFCLIDFCFLQGPFWLICHLRFSRRGIIFTFSLCISWLLAFQTVFSSDNSWPLSVLCRVMRYSTSVFISERFFENICLASTSDYLDLCVYSLVLK